SPKLEQPQEKTAERGPQGDDARRAEVWGQSEDDSDAQKTEVDGPPEHGRSLEGQIRYEDSHGVVNEAGEELGADAEEDHQGGGRQDEQNFSPGKVRKACEGGGQ